MARLEVGFKGAKLVAVEIDSASVQVEADSTNGVAAGTLQEAIEALAARVQALEDAAA
ncbi:hypothetical protein [Rhodococcus sp. HS-D2]|uniref:hypothetical protein n=1 Tax=Rhodococcus sp. HS-D2 TaxID=1384636 RepID=UPI000A703A9D|nr:hypothetical protein [Rhodococcus sp. HS-D2]